MLTICAPALYRRFVRLTDAHVGLEERLERPRGKRHVARARRLEGGVHRKLRTTHVDRMHAHLHVGEIAQGGTARHIAAVRKRLQRHARASDSEIARPRG